MPRLIYFKINLLYFIYSTNFPKIEFMNKWKSKLQNIFERADDWSDDVKLRLKNLTEYDDSLRIVPYIGFGNNERILLSGRVLENEKPETSSETDSNWKNLVNMYRRFETDEVPNARVKAVFQNIRREVITNREGYFYLNLEYEQSSVFEIWNKIELELLAPIGKGGQNATAKGQILIPPETAKFGVISDIDDTVIKTNVVSKTKMILTTVLSNEHTRLPFEGVAKFYSALQKGASGDENNPIFYVSSSPWNLYGLLIEFLKKQKIPLGPLFLKDFGTHTVFQASEHQTHKLENIRQILEMYPQMPFILIGDDGEQDPEIYRRIVKEYPDKIRAIYIRKTGEEPENADEIGKLINEVRESGSQIIFAPDSEFAAMHAAGENLISADALPEIHEEKLLDKNSIKAEDVSEENLLQN